MCCFEVKRYTAECQQADWMKAGNQLLLTPRQALPACICMAYRTPSFYWAGKIVFER